MSYDIVVRLDGEPVTGVDDLIRMLNGDRIGRAVEVDVVRRGHSGASSSGRSNVRQRKLPDEGSPLP